MQAAKKFTNKLIGETSPYLLQHAHNPVDWYPWGEEAFERARAEDKPLLVSIGYSACHWCHVMEHESFEDEKIAEVQNRHFINIKVDMEERPDVDQIYMSFVQVTTGRGGWPMNVFITPDKMPFFGGTYFPPSQRYNMPSWPQVLMSIADAWDTKRDELLHSANEIVGELRRMSLTELAGGIDESLSEHAYKAFVKSFDAKNGGFGGAPKFPAAMAMEFLLRYWKRTGDSGALEMVRKTAETMAKGGIYDQLGGGFHRYAVDAIWLVPHFEKMLYDNAQLIRVLLHLFQVFRAAEESAGKPAFPTENGNADSAFFRRIAVETLEYVRREMTDAIGAFYSTQDADSEGHEGKFFVWTPEEIAVVLGEEDAREFCALYDVTAGGNFEGSNIPNIRGGITGDLGGGSDADALGQAGRLRSSRERLFEAREKRVKPFRDEKVLTAWNGLMLAAFAEAAAVLDEPQYLEVAKANADFLLREMVVHDDTPQAALQAGTPAVQSFRVLRTWKDGKAKLNGYIEDYANLADGLIELYQVSGEAKYLHSARELADAMITEFWDEENGGFFFTSNDHEELIVRNKEFSDNATPSGNSVAADVLLKLSKLYGEEKYERFATTVLRLAASQIRRFPSGFGRTLGAIEFRLADVKEIAIVGGERSEVEREVWSEYRPFKVVASGGDVPLLDGRDAIDGKPTVYVCENFVCQRPVAVVEELRELL
ncbi:MAG: thioredoxin domain-containing protein [Pyrinomonadaceae bacterium]